METKRQQQHMVRVMGSARDALARYRDRLQGEVLDAVPSGQIYGPFKVTMSDALEEAMRLVGELRDSRVHDLMTRLSR